MCVCKKVGGCYALKGFNLSYSPTFAEKLFALLGLNPRLDFCGKHKIWFEKVDRNKLQEIWVCPRCFEEKFEREGITPEEGLLSG